MRREVVDTAKRLCRDLRRKSTPGEQVFWQTVRSRKVLGKKFLRQFQIFFEYMNKETFFIADFYCHENRLIVEIDGKSHDYQKDYDSLRTHIINNLGIHVVRFASREVQTDINGVLERLHAVLTL